MNSSWAFLLVVLFLIAVLTLKFWWPFNKVSFIASRHVGAKAGTLSSISRPFARIDLPNIEKALRSIDANARRIGVGGGMFAFRAEDLGSILSGNMRAVGVRTQSAEIGTGETMACMVNGIVFVRNPGRAVVYVRLEEMTAQLEVHVAAKDPKVAEDILKLIDDSSGRSSVYKGRIISLACDKVAGRGPSCLSLRFHEPPGISASDLILPQTILELIERNTVGFFQTIEKMRAVGRSTKKGLLLYGRPGTGKTMTAKWIASSIPGLTTLFLSADQLFLIKDCCQMARMLSPAMVVLEDVDLVARDRGKEEDIATRITLNQLLNEMDGIADNAGVLFLMTSNRAEELEHALTARPGRVDQAIEYPMPDAACRRLLFEKYLDGLRTESIDMEDLVSRTDGAPPAFIQELVRKSLTISLLDPTDPPLRQVHFRTAFQELLFMGGDLTRKLLGFSEELLDT